jgi:hypothetical protein
MTPSLLVDFSRQLGFEVGSAEHWNMEAASECRKGLEILKHYSY